MKAIIMDDIFNIIERFLVGNYLDKFYHTEFDSSMSDQERLFVIDNIRVDSPIIDWKTIKKYWKTHYNVFIDLVDKGELL